jgi:hypothetical protein
MTLVLTYLCLSLLVSSIVLGGLLYMVAQQPKIPCRATVVHYRGEGFRSLGLNFVVTGCKPGDLEGGPKQGLMIWDIVLGEHKAIRAELRSCVLMPMGNPRFHRDWRHRETSPMAAHIMLSRSEIESAAQLAALQYLGWRER